MKFTYVPKYRGLERDRMRINIQSFHNCGKITDMELAAWRRFRKNKSTTEENQTVLLMMQRLGFIRLEKEAKP